jgi:hypothetical protein
VIVPDSFVATATPKFVLPSLFLPENWPGWMRFLGLDFCGGVFFSALALRTKNKTQLIKMVHRHTIDANNEV